MNTTLMIWQGCDLGYVEENDADREGEGGQCRVDEEGAGVRMVGARQAMSKGRKVQGSGGQLDVDRLEDRRQMRYCLKKSN